MSKSRRFTVRPSNIPGWFNVVDSKDGSIVHEIRGSADANARARGLNRAEDAKPKPKPFAPVGYIEVVCEMCPAILSIKPGGSKVCPRCREEAEAIIEWRETRDAQLKAAEEELMETSVRRVTMAVCLD